MLNVEPPLLADGLGDLVAWVVKDGVALGGLTPEMRQRALAVAWAGLPTVVMSEKAVNAALLLQLAGAARFLATDHVELRRWLVDAGWLTRDGYGREYHRVAASDLPGTARAVAEVLATVDVAAWVAQARLRQTVQRDRRRQAWSAAQMSSSP